jgi:hypothetical protein
VRLRHLNEIEGVEKAANFDLARQGLAARLAEFAGQHGFLVNC